MEKKKPVLISGIQPSGRLHIGNYLGALKNFVDLQNSGKYECLFFIADYHSLTESHDPKEKQKQVSDLMASYLAAGLDPKKSTLFIQSHVPQVTELMWILNTLTPMGELNRMTQYKEKSGGLTRGQAAARFAADLTQKIVSSGNSSFEKQKRLYINQGYIRDKANSILDTGVANAGLFTYPVLMAADILIYDVANVPVGDDQLQHLEFARTIARKFNNRFGNVFTEPEPILTATPRVMSLANPAKKMSKSEPKGCLFLDDSPEEITAKLMSAVTDAGSEVKYNEKEKPGISNLLGILSGLTNKKIPSLEKQFKTSGYGGFKRKAAEDIAHSLAPFREAKARLLKNQTLIKKAFDAGAKKAGAKAEEKMRVVKKITGLI